MVLILTGLDLLVTNLIFDPTDIPGFFLPVQLFLVLLSLIILVLAYRIWKIILLEEAKVKTRYKNVLIIAAMLTLFSGFFSLLTYLLQIVLFSGFLGPSYSEINLTINQGEISHLVMLVTSFLKFFYYIFAFVGCLLTGCVWTRQFRLWARFSETKFIRSFYIVGVVMILLFITQIATTLVQYLIFWLNFNLDDLPIGVSITLFILLLISTLLLPIYVYFLTVAGEILRTPQELEKKPSKMKILLPLVFIFLWFIVNMATFGETEADPVVTLLGSLLGTSLLIMVFIPISLGFYRHATRVESPYLRKNLNLATLGTLGLSLYSIGGPTRWTGMSAIIGYLLAFSVLTWSLASISQFLGSREALLQRLKKAGAEFLADMGEAEMKDQSLRQMSKVMSDVSREYIEDLEKIEVRTPPSEEEIRRYIVRTMGVESSPSETQVLSYLRDAISMVKRDQTLR